MKFETEAELVKLLMEKGRCIPATKGWRTSSFVTEFDSSFGRADLVLYELVGNWQGTLELGKICPKWAYALRSLPYRKAFSSDDFFKLTGVSKKPAAIALGHFVDLRYCDRLKKKDQWIKLVQPRAVVNEILAVEAKLRDWTKALSQAYRYREYANRSWVVLDAASIKPALANIEKFKRLNIGLGSIGKDGSFTVHHKPNKLQPQSSLRFWQANAQIASQLLSHPNAIT